MDTMRSGLFVGVVLVVLIVILAIAYVAMRVLAGRTQSREQAAALTKPAQTPAAGTVRPPD